jgi:hypothetical protein
MKMQLFKTQIGKRSDAIYIDTKLVPTIHCAMANHLLSPYSFTKCSFWGKGIFFLSQHDIHASKGYRRNYTLLVNLFIGQNGLPLWFIEYRTTCTMNYQEILESQLVPLAALCVRPCQMVVLRMTPKWNVQSIKSLIIFGISFFVNLFLQIAHL